MPTYDLALIMPVYNEQDCIVGVINEWLEVLDGLEIDYVIYVFNDGSKDATLDRLQSVDHERLKVIDKNNSGHGPTILAGYHKAVKEAQWVFQCDSDGEMAATSFHLLWEKRDRFDALFGFREQRIQSKGRAFISHISRMAVRLFFGQGVKDVNTPYRLMKASILAEIIGTIPDNTFAPNVLISGEFVRRKSAIFNTPVFHEHRRTGSVSIVRWGLWKAAAKSFLQTVIYRCKHV